MGLLIREFGFVHYEKSDTAPNYRASEGFFEVFRLVMFPSDILWF